MFTSFGDLNYDSECEKQSKNNKDFYPNFDFWKLNNFANETEEEEEEEESENETNIVNFSNNSEISAANSFKLNLKTSRIVSNIFSINDLSKVIFFFNIESKYNTNVKWMKWISRDQFLEKVYSIFE